MTHVPRYPAGPYQKERILSSRKTQIYLLFKSNDSSTVPMGILFRPDGAHFTWASPSHFRPCALTQVYSSIKPPPHLLVERTKTSTSVIQGWQGLSLTFTGQTLLNY